MSVVVGLFGPLKVRRVFCSRNGDCGGVLFPEKSGESHLPVLWMYPTCSVSAESCRTLEYTIYTYNPITKIYKMMPLGPPMADNTFEIPDAPAVITVAEALDIDPTTVSFR